jgi:hypothetical protein
MTCDHLTFRDQARTGYTVSASGIVACAGEIFVAEEFSLSRSPDAPLMWEKFRLAPCGRSESAPEA